MFVSSTTSQPPFPFNQRRVVAASSQQLFGCGGKLEDEDTAFKFDSRLMIVEKEEEVYDDEAHDSGIGKYYFIFISNYYHYILIV